MTRASFKAIPAAPRRHGLDTPAALLAVLLLLAALLWTRPAFAADADDPGPHHLIVTYRSEARDRVAFRAYLAGEGRAPFEKLLKQGALNDYQILFNTVYTNTWDAMVVMSFKRHADTGRWTEIERAAPAGLSPKGLKLAKPITSFWADLTWQGALPDARARGAVFYVIPYTYLTTFAEYKNYVDGYVVPQVEGWMREGVLSGYRIYMNRYTVGMPWDALFVYQYKDLAAFGRRDAVLAKVRTGLKDDANWQKLHAVKQKLRSESENTISELLEAR